MIIPDETAQENERPMMKKILLFVLFPAAVAIAQTGPKPPLEQIPDSTVSLNGHSPQNWLPHPRVEPDGMVIGSTKYFIRIVPVNPMIDPGMIVAFPPETASVMRVPPPGKYITIVHPR